MFRTSIYPSSGACDYAVELPHWSFCFCFAVLQASACNTDTTQTQPHQISNTQRNKNKTTNVVIQQHSSKLLMMDILMSETFWVHNKLNKIASDIKLVFYSSAITMMHGPVSIRLISVFKLIKIYWITLTGKPIGTPAYVAENTYKLTQPTWFEVCLIFI